MGTGAQRACRLLVAAAAALLLLAPPDAGAAQRYVDEVFDGVEMIADVRFGAAINDRGERQVLRLDIRAPAGDAARRRPAVVWLFGGGFKGGSKGDVAGYATQFARRGYVTFAPDYRVRPNGPPNAEILARTLVGDPEISREARHDVQAAIRWIRAHAPQLGVDPRRIVVGGYSAGGIIALGVAFDPEDPGDSGDVTPAQASSESAGTLVISGGADTRRIERPPPPTLMFHGAQDTTVPYARGAETCEGIRLNGGHCEFVTWPEADHGPSRQRLAEVVPHSAVFLCDRLYDGCNPPPEALSVVRLAGPVVMPPAFRLSASYPRFARRGVPAIVFGLSQRALVGIQFGRVSGGRIEPAGMLVTARGRGIHRLLFGGRLSRTRYLRPGYHVVRILARDPASGVIVRTRLVLFRVLAPR